VSGISRRFDALVGYHLRDSQDVLYGYDRGATLHDVHDIRHEPDQSESHSPSEDQCDGVFSGPLEFNFFGLRIAAHSSLQVDQPEGMALAACKSSLQSECEMALVTEVFGQDCGMVHWLWLLISAMRKPSSARGARRTCIAFGLHFIVCKKYHFSPTFGSHVLSHLTCSLFICIPSVLPSKTLTCAASHAA
jgi:hypothetical protein